MKKYKIVEVSLHAFLTAKREAGEWSTQRKKTSGAQEACGLSGMLRRVMGLRDADFWKA
jgi:hypothetical protein